MSSTMEQEQQEELNKLVQASLEGDVLFVLYHLQRLDLTLVNQLDSVHHLTPLQAALSLSAPCSRRWLILTLLLVAGASGSAPEDFRSAWIAAARNVSLPSSETEVRTARILLYDMPIKDSEIWLHDNGLDGVGEISAREADESTSPSRPTSPSSSAEPLQIFTSDDSGCMEAPTSPSKSQLHPSVDLTFTETSTQDSRATSQALSHSTAPSSVTTSPDAVQSFIVDCLPSSTDTPALRSFLECSLGRGLIIDINPAFSYGSNGHRVLLRNPVPVEQNMELEQFELDGETLKVQVGQEATERGLFEFSASRGRPRYRSTHLGAPVQHSPSWTVTNAAPLAHSFPPPSSNTRGRPFSYYAYDDTQRLGSQEAPPRNATQAELDYWAEESFRGRWAADLPCVRESWDKTRGIVWRGRLCYDFPPKAGALRYPCWGRNCDFAHDPAELRHPDGSLVDPIAAFHFARRPWKAPPSSPSSAHQPYPAPGPLPSGPSTYHDASNHHHGPLPYYGTPPPNYGPPPHQYGPPPPLLSQHPYNAPPPCFQPSPPTQPYPYGPQPHRQLFSFSG